MRNKLMQYIKSSKYILMEGAILERLKHEFHINIDNNVALANIVYDDVNKEKIKFIYKEYIETSIKYNIPIMITTPTRRANFERINNSIYDKNIIKDNVNMIEDIRKEFNTDKIFIGGLMGCSGDAYSNTTEHTVESAYKFHSWQAKLFSETKIDFLYAGIMPTLIESLGIAKAMSDTNIPYIISFMINKEGTLLDGTFISDAIKEIDCRTENKPLFYMSNCVYPTVVFRALENEVNNNEIVRERFRGIQCNASDKEYDKLNDSGVLETSNAIKYIKSLVPLLGKNIKVIGGCCGTNNTHIEAIAKLISEI
ncbi:MAG: homocysteine S-methyltransferase family protein [Clostridium sp.]|uniref:homocysteine S-methyltransferase family protein n=1 Tax=Clostridium sp. TaxID=1506 RepID=UPI003F32D944